MGEREQSSSHARVSERRKALAILRTVPPFAGRQMKRVFGRRVVQSIIAEGVSSPRHDAAATTSARALSRRGAHVRVSPSLGAARPVATHHESLGGDPGRRAVREEGNLFVKGAAARSEQSGTRLLLEASDAGRESALERARGLRHGVAKAAPVRARIERSWVVPARRSSVLQKSMGDALIQRSAGAGPFSRNSARAWPRI